MNFHNLQRCRSNTAPQGIICIFKQQNTKKFLCFDQPVNGRRFNQCQRLNFLIFGVSMRQQQAAKPKLRGWITGLCRGLNHCKPLIFLSVRASAHQQFVTEIKLSSDISLLRFL